MHSSEAKHVEAAVPYLIVKHSFHALASDISAVHRAACGKNASTELHKQQTVSLVRIKLAYMYAAQSGSPLGSSVH